MIRFLLLFLLMAVLYYAVKILFQSAFNAYHQDDEPQRLPGREMVQDPQCRTYVVKDRAVVRRIGGTAVHFCSKACADAYEKERA